MKNKRDFFIEKIYCLKNEVYRMVLSVLADEGVAEDITQTVFEKAWRKLEDLKEPDKAKQWIKAITRNEVRDYLRKKRRRERWLVRPDSSDADFADGSRLESIEKDILEKIVESENRARVVRALEIMDRRDREIITMNLVMELSLKEIAETLDLNYGSVRVLYSRAIGRFRKLYFILEKGGK